MNEVAMHIIARSDWIYRQSEEADYGTKRGLYSQALSRLLERSLSPTPLTVPSDLKVVYEMKRPEMYGEEGSTLHACVIYAAGM